MQIAKLFAPLCLLCVLTGCSANFNPTLTSTPIPASIGNISGKAFGGQQPLVGAHVYLLAAGTGGNGGNSIAASTSNASTSLLTNSNASGFQTTIDGSGNYYVTTNSNGSFSIGGEYTCTSGTQVYLYAVGGNPGAGVNSAAALLAILGNCPISGTLASQVPTVAMDEVSTVAAAYSFAAFATDATHVSSSGTPLALTGIANAFANSAQMYQIDGTGAFPGAALATTPGGNGTIPQSKINTIANIIAACLNSTGPGSSSCSTLLTSATSDGTGSGTQPTDVATAAINIAHHPGANISALFGLQTAIGSTFTPSLSSAPNDFAIAIYYSDAHLCNVQGLVVDASGNPWTVSPCGWELEEFTPLGVSVPGVGMTTSAGNNVSAAIDPSNNIWTANGTREYSSVGSLVTTVTGGGSSGTMFAFDSSSNLYYPNRPSRNIQKLASGGSSYSTSFSASGHIYQAMAVDAANNVWAARADSGNVDELQPGGTTLIAGEPSTGWNINAGGNGCFAIAIDKNGNAWLPFNGLANVAEISSTGTLISGTYALPSASNGANAIAVDGANTIWTANLDGSVSNLNSSNGGAISPSTGYSNATGNGNAGMAIDGSGNIWMTDTFYLIEMIGVASPVATPLVANVVNHTVGVRP